MSRAQASMIKRDNLREQVLEVKTEGHVHAIQRSRGYLGTGNMVCTCGINQAGSSARPVNSERATGSRQRGSAGRAVTSSQRSKSAARPVQWQRGACGYCGTVHSRFECPAYGKTCRKCNKLNHFSKMCRAGHIHTVQEDTSDRDSEAS
ncbi:uncharacterized protein LOC123723199 [Papilio machaon]|nr:uncharacterized protein LOC123723199 [Papilio machaon]